MAKALDAEKLKDKEKEDEMAEEMAEAGDEPLDEEEDEGEGEEENPEEMKGDCDKAKKAVEGEDTEEYDIVNGDVVVKAITDALEPITAALEGVMKGQRVLFNRLKKLENVPTEVANVRTAQKAVNKAIKDLEEPLRIIKAVATEVEEDASKETSTGDTAVIVKAVEGGVLDRKIGTEANIEQQSNAPMIEKQRVVSKAAEMKVLTSNDWNTLQSRGIAGVDDNMVERLKKAIGE